MTIPLSEFGASTTLLPARVNRDMGALAARDA
jgi:hypothetical protein